MAAFFNELKSHFEQGNALKRLIIVNAAVFVIVSLVGVIGQLFRFELNITSYLSLSSLPKEALTQPWTILTYMFMHHDLLHILFNMLWLYWFGGIFMQLFTQKQLVALYLFGGVSGALLYLLAYNTIPFYIGQPSSLLGASAAVLAIVCATAFRIPDYSVRLFLIGEVKLKYIAAATILIDLLSITSTNAGGHVAHLGGAVMGYFFIWGLKQGVDITKGFNRLMDKMASLSFSRPKPKMKVTYKRAESDMEYKARKNQDTKQLDLILDKLKKSGYASLTPDEKKFLFDASKR
jgi:membrane associated rhomboid family serine protease